MWLLPEMPSQTKGRDRALRDRGLLPVTAAAVTASVCLGRSILSLAAVALIGFLVDVLGWRSAGLAITAATLVMLCLGLAVAVLLAYASDVTQVWRGWIRGVEFTMLYSQGISFWRTVWSGIRGTDRLYQRRRGYQILSRS